MSTTVRTRSRSRSAVVKNTATTLLVIQSYIHSRSRRCASICHDFFVTPTRISTCKSTRNARNCRELMHRRLNCSCLEFLLMVNFYTVGSISIRGLMMALTRRSSPASVISLQAQNNPASLRHSTTPAIQSRSAVPSIFFPSAMSKSSSFPLEFDIQPKARNGNQCWRNKSGSGCRLPRHHGRMQAEAMRLKNIVMPIPSPPPSHLLTLST